MSDVMAVYTLKLQNKEPKKAGAFKSWVQTKAQKLAAANEYHAELTETGAERSIAYLAFPR